MDVEVWGVPGRSAQRLIAIAMLAASVVACSSKADFTTLEEALERQPAELVASFDDGFVIGDAEAPCGFPRHAELLRLDAGSGELAWERAVPWAPDGPVVIGNTVVAVGRTIDGNPPSVVAADLRTGVPLWQRFFSSESLRLVSATGSHVVVQSDERLLALNVDSGEVRWDEHVGAAHLLVPSVGPETRGGSSPTSEAIAVFSTGEDLLVADLSSGGVSDLGHGALAAVDGTVVFIVADGVVKAYSGAADAALVWESDPLPLGGVYSEPIQLVVGSDAVVVVIGSDVGPDHRVMVLEAQTGQLRWQDDGVRDVTIAKGVLLLDRRLGSDPEGLTRQTVGRSPASGGQLWLRRSSGALGGYLGTSPAGLVFGVADGPEGDVDRVVRLNAISGQGALATEEPLAGGSTGDSRSLVTDDLIVVPSRASSIVAFGGANVARRWVRELDYPLRGASLAGDGLLIAVGDPDYGCE